MSLEFISGLTHIHHVALLIDEYHDHYKVSEKRKTLNKEYHKLFKYTDNFNCLMVIHSDYTFSYNCRDLKSEYDVIFNPDTDIHPAIPRWYFEYTPWKDNRRN